MWFDSIELQILLKAMKYYKANILPFIPFDDYSETVEEIINKLENADED